MLDAGDARVVEWLRANIGGTITRFERQARWRPQWLVDVVRDGGTVELLVRGQRTDTAQTWSLEHEMRFQRVLQDHGVAVPKVWGWVDDPVAFVTDRVPGQADFRGTPEADRAQVVDEYLHALAQIHALPVEPFVAAGIDRAPTPDGSGQIGLERMEALYRRQKEYPDPQLEFFLGWLRRNPPRSDGRETPVVWDSGQFMHTGGHLVAVIDLELAHLGDPMMDLAGWRMRDSVIPFGNFAELYERYAEISGRPVDLEAVQLHHLAFTLSNQLAFSHARYRPPPDGDLATLMQWCNETNLYATEALAEYLGFELPTVDVPDPEPSLGAPAMEQLVRTLSTVTIDDPFARFRVRGAFRLARHLQRRDEIGRQVLDADLDDVHRLLGRRPESWEQAELDLERFVLAAADDGRHDEALCHLFHRRNLRAQMLNGPAGSAMARHLPIQRFRD